MSFYYLIFTLIINFICIYKAKAAIHDDLPQCGLAGIYKTRQTILQTPKYPDNYPPNICWDWVIRSPFRCPTKFHIQFLDFQLETSTNCSRDYLAIGLENDDDDMDVLCGQVIGIKKYYTPDGVLRLRFYSDDSPWTTGKGFKILITRLACERIETRYRVNDDNQLMEEQEDTENIEAPLQGLEPPNTVDSLPPILQNLSIIPDQYRPYPLAPIFGLNLPTAFSSGFYVPQTQLFNQYALNGNGVTNVKDKPCTETQKTTTNTNTLAQGINQFTSTQLQQQAELHQQQQHQQQQLLHQQQQQQQQQLAHLPPYITATQQLPQQFTSTPIWLNRPLVKAAADPFEVAVEDCCVSSFRQKHFYLSSPGFPRTALTSLLPTQHRDCNFHFDKSTQNVCRLRIEFKFFDFGQSNTGTGDDAIGIINTSRDVCTGDFIEIDGQRFCGCRSGFTYNSLWVLGRKAMRMRMGQSGLPSSGFLLEMTQEECTGVGVGVGAGAGAGAVGGAQLPQLIGGIQQDPTIQTINGQNNFLPGGATLTNLQATYLNDVNRLNGANRVNGLGSVNGINGVNGFNGVNGLNGINSANGLNGVNAVNGFNGVNGVNGLNGLNGLNGVNGLNSVNAVNGFNGVNGVNGLNAFPPQINFVQQLPPNLRPESFNQQLFNAPFTGNDYLQQQQQQQLLQNLNAQTSQGLLALQQQQQQQQRQQQHQLFGLSQFPQFLRRDSRVLDTDKLTTSNSQQQPVTVVETNSTRKEFYYYDGDEALAREKISNEPAAIALKTLRRSDDNVAVADVNHQRRTDNNTPTARARCTFDASEALRLTVDTLWLRRPVCWAPTRSWFSNILG